MTTAGIWWLALIGAVAAGKNNKKILTNIKIKYK
jgi:hypothetical protein